MALPNKSTYLGLVFPLFTKEFNFAISPLREFFRSTTPPWGPSKAISYGEGDPCFAEAP